MKALKKYDLLYTNKIMFLDEKKLINHINSNWQQIDKWWNNSENQLSILKFNENFNLKSSKKSISNLAKDLANI